MRRQAALFLIFLLAVGCASAQTSKKSNRKTSKSATAVASMPPGLYDAIHSVSDARIKADIRTLSSDDMQGRGTGAPGGDKAAEFIAEQFKAAKLVPMGDNGSYLQKVPMVGITTLPDSAMSLVTPKQTMQLRQLDDAVIMDETQKPVSDTDSKLLFIGYGITAPEFGWDDYAGQDVKGKVLLMLVNEPPSTDDKFFGGKALTYYGRWTYKFEHAAQMGAAGVILIHKTEMASYGWDVVRNSWSGERAYLRANAAPKLQLASWIQLDIARKALADAGKNLDELMKAAQQKGFKAIPLPIEVKAHVANKVRPFEASNVIGAVEGSDMKLKEQGVILTAHYDHLGMRPDLKGDNIYNGALDNATGTAMLIEMARAAAGAPVKPKRTLIFAAVTGEEQGLLGSEFLGQHPPIPDSRISLDLNFDSIAPLGIPKQTSAGGYDRTTFASVFEKTAADFGMKILPPAHPESGGYYRSDHFSFAKVGVPAFSVNTGSVFEGHPEAWVKAKQKKFGENYHQPGDEFQEDADYRSNAVMARFGLALAWKAADLPGLVQWKKGDEFEAARKTD